MDRFKGLVRDTWWLWLGLIFGGLAMALLLDRIFLISIPIAFFSFIYFGYMRYDDNGKPKGDV